MKPKNGQFFEQEEPNEYALPGDEPTYVKAMNYIPQGQHAPQPKVAKLPGKSLREYYRKKK